MNINTKMDLVGLYYLINNSIKLSPDEDASPLIRAVEKIVDNNPIFDIVQPQVAADIFAEFKAYGLRTYVLEDEEKMDGFSQLSIRIDTVAIAAEEFDYAEYETPVADDSEVSLPPIAPDHVIKNILIDEYIDMALDLGSEYMDVYQVNSYDRANEFMNSLIASSNGIIGTSHRGLGNVIIVQKDLWDSLRQYNTVLTPKDMSYFPYTNLNKVATLMDRIDVYAYSGDIDTFNFITTYVGKGMTGNSDAGIVNSVVGVELHDTGIRLKYKFTAIEGAEKFYVLGK